MNNYFLGLDVGTNESKGVLIDDSGLVIAQSSKPHDVENPKPNYFEHDADKIWYNDICFLSRDLIEKSNINPEKIKGVGISALSSDCLPVDKNGKPLRKAILYGIDARAMKECEFLTEKWGEKEVIKRFGRSLGSSDVVPKILWIKRNEPEVYDRTHKFLTASSYLVFKLTGNYTIDRFLGLASFNPLYNNDGSINEKFCEGICSPNQLATVKWTTDIAGHVTKKAAEDTGLCEGTPVITGGDDSGAEAISSGVMSPGDLLIQLGSTVYMILCTDRLINDHRLWREQFIIPGTYDISAGTNTAGSLTKWIRNNFYFDKLSDEHRGGKNTYEIMMKEIKNIPIGSNGLIMLPYFAGERTPINDSKAKGMIIGLNLNHNRHDITRSAFESICYSIKQHFDIFEELDVPVNNIMITGGGTKNSVWLQMLADVLNKELKIPEITIGASFGNALMTMIGVGYKKNFSDAKNLVKLGETVKPNLNNHKEYMKFYDIFTKLYQVNKTLMHKLNDINEVQRY